MTAPESSARDLAKLLTQAREENRQLRERWDTIKRLVLGEWQRGTKMPYSLVKPFIDGSGPAFTSEKDDSAQEESP